ncbi:MAG TPA: hypothetical protein VMT10_12470 [Solirubrobacteraceae bacterium]|nr:hypothetical protein [Solirubrobacteraceae bacterium]
MTSGSDTATGAGTPPTGSRVVFADGEWMTSELSLEEVAAFMEAGRLIPAQRNGKRVLVNPAHVLSAEEWATPLPEGAGG